MPAETDPAAFAVLPLQPGHRDAYLHFFDHEAFADNPRWASCYCQFPTADHEAVPWKQRSREENRASACRRVEAGLQRGVVAEAEGRIVGWCNAGPRSSMTIVDDAPHPLAERCGAITCFVVAPAWRGKGVATALLQGACEQLRAAGLELVEAWTQPDANGPAENHTGPLAMYLKAGFEVIRPDVDGGVVLRKWLVPHEAQA